MATIPTLVHSQTAFLGALSSLARQTTNDPRHRLDGT